MNATKLRDGNYAAMRAELPQKRREVYDFLFLATRNHPEGLTTRELAFRMNRSVLEVRPRMTELCQQGLARCVGRKQYEVDGRTVSEGAYVALEEGGLL